MTISLQCLQGQRTQIQILVIEDNPADVDLVRNALAGRNAALDSVDRISAGLSHVASHEPDAVLLDLGLPDAQGLEGLLALRSAAPSVPVIVLTGTSDGLIGDEAVKHGAEDYLAKQDLDDRLLWRAVRYAIERNRSREREKLLAVERTARSHAEQANRAKDWFLAVLAHELRNPLAPITFALDVMEHANATEEQQNQAKHAMRRQVRQLVRLVDDLLDVSRITQKKLVLQKQWVSLSAVIVSAVESAMPVIQAGGHEFRVSSPVPDIELYVDAARITQTLSNLLNNAAKYTPTGGRIWLEACRKNEYAIICVGDSGIGFHPDAAPRLFEMFYQENASHCTGGLGIGLSLAQQLAEMHGGELRASSRGKGLGAEFVVRLPIDLTQAAPQPSAEASGGWGTSTPLQVLIVDDNIDAAELMALYIRQLGHHTIVAYDAESALSMIHSVRADVALLDIGLPGMDGYELARQLRASSSCRNVHLVAITGWGQDEDLTRSRQAGFEQHFTKPIDTERLRQLLAVIAARADAKKPIRAVALPDDAPGGRPLHARSLSDY